MTLITQATPESRQQMDLATDASRGTTLRQMMLSATRATNNDSSQAQEQLPSEISIGGRVYHPNVTYVVWSNTAVTQTIGALLDWGANGGLLGSDARVLETDPVNTIDAIGITNDTKTALPIV